MSRRVSLPGADELVRTTGGTALQPSAPRRPVTGEARVPHGTFPGATESLASFRKLRATIAQFAKSTEEDLRGRQLKGGNMDVYQWVLMISTHSQRHIMQVREVKAHAGYPKGRT